MKKFPTTLYVTREGEGTNDEYLTADDETPSVDDTTVVAVYRLVEVGKVTVTREYASPKKRGR